MITFMQPSGKPGRSGYQARAFSREHATHVAVCDGIKLSSSQRWDLRDMQRAIESERSRALVFDLYDSRPCRVTFGQRNSLEVAIEAIDYSHRGARGIGNLRRTRVRMERAMERSRGEYGT